MNAQSANLGSMQEISLIKRVNDLWKLNVNLESRIEHLDTKNINSNLETHYVLTDFSVLASRKLKHKYSLSFGYLSRFQNTDRINRFIQQFAIVDKMFRYTLSHRFMTDQTFINSQNISYRLRYRFVFERALSGLRVDANEWYLKVGNEVVTIYRNELFNLEHRITPTFGYAFSDANKLELGLDTRFKSLIHNEIEFENWLTINWFYSF